MLPKATLLSSSVFSHSTADVPGIVKNFFFFFFWVMTYCLSPKGSCMPSQTSHLLLASLTELHHEGPHENACNSLT